MNTNKMLIFDKGFQIESQEYRFARFLTNEICQ